MILKWPGGKKWLLKEVSHLIPAKINHYIEPFLGGGSFFFALSKNDLLPSKISKGYLSDINPRLIKVFNELKENPSGLYKKTKALVNKHSDEHYYAIRDKFNKDEAPEKFLYLNRTCFNGVYRQYNSGAFNVPVGKRKKIALPSKEEFLDLSERLKNYDLSSCDFEGTLDKAKKGDFIFLDPPYLDRDDYESASYKTFRKYNAKEFSIPDLERMALKANKLSKKCNIIISNFSVPLVREYFSKSDGWNYFEVEKTTFISGKAKGRVKVREAVIHNL